MSCKDKGVNWASVLRIFKASTSACAVSKDVRQGTLYSTAMRRCKNPERSAFRPCVGVLSMRLTSPEAIRLRTLSPWAL